MTSDWDIVKTQKMCREKQTLTCGYEVETKGGKEKGGEEGESRKQRGKLQL